MMEFLLRTGKPGYPADYLFSRIRGKRAHLVTDWEYVLSMPDPLGYLTSTLFGPDGFSADGVWLRLLREYRWTYTGMNEVLRRIFRPFFLYAELRTLFISLRYIKGREEVKLGRLLSTSMLSEGIKKILLSGGDVVAVVRRVGEAFATLSENLAGLGKAFSEGGLRAVENDLTNGYLEHSAATVLHPVTKLFFINIIDARNILSLYKYLRLEARTPPSFIKGGGIGEKGFIDIRDRRDMSGLLSLAVRVTGDDIGVPDAAEIENALYRGITRRLRKAGRDPFGAGLVLDYLWRCSIEARNLSTLFYGRDLDRDTLIGEMIR